MSYRTALARGADVALFGASGLLSLYLLANLLSYEYGRDQGIYAVVAEAVLRGGAPYRDAWDFKPPGIHFAFTLGRALFGAGMYGVRVIEAAALVSIVCAFVVLSRRHVGSARPGLLAGALALLVYVPLEFWDTAQPEGFGAAALAWALVAASRQLQRRADWADFSTWAAAAALYAVAALMKPPLGAGVLVSLAIVVQRRRASGAGVAAPLLAFALGGMLPLLATAAWFQSRGALGELLEALFVFTPHYTGLGFEAQRLPALLLTAVRLWLYALSPYALLGFVPLLVLAPLGSREREGIVHVLGVVGLSLLGVALQAKFFDYHFAAALLLGALPAGWGWWKLWLRARHSPIGVAALASVAVALHMGWVPFTRDLDRFWARCAERVTAWREPERSQAIRDALYLTPDFESRSNRRTAEFLARHTPANASVYIWGFEPVIYDLAGRRPASRYVYNVPQRVPWASESARRELLLELEAAAPAAVVIGGGDALPWVTGNARDSREELANFPELRDWIERGYAATIARFGAFEVRLRR